MYVKYTPFLKRQQLKWLYLFVLLFVFTLTSQCSPLERNANPLIMTVLGHPHTLLPGSQSSLQVQLWHQRQNKPVVEAQVTAYLIDVDDVEVVFAGQTDENGLINVQFQVPQQIESSEHQLAIQAEKDNYIADYQQRVYVGHVYHILVSTDKPVYQPGQTIHLRTLALDSTALKAAQDQPLTLMVQDPQGNRVMQKELTTSRWGIAVTDFRLDSQAASGDYTIIATMGQETSRRTVEVKPYKLPRFKINFQSDKSFYLPGEIAKISLDAQYFFGKPISGGQVRVNGYVTDVSRELIFTLSDGTLNDQGFYEFDLPLPETLIGQVESNTAKVDLEITIIDTAKHAERSTESLTLAAQPLLIEAIPESGVLRPGLENIIYLQASYPNGQPARVEFTVDIVDHFSTILQNNIVQTNDSGLVTITFTPQSRHDTISLNITARDEQGHIAAQNLPLGTMRSRQAVLLRPHKTAYRIGENLNVDAFVAGQATTVFLDVVKGGQTFALAALPVQDGVARAEIPLDGSLLGTLELHAYIIAHRGEIVRDRRLVLVDPAPSQVEVQADAASYRPGDTATLNISVSHQNETQPSVLGLSIVDESVFAVGAQNPGFARTYFLLERELLEPRYEIHDFAPLSGEGSPYDRHDKSSRPSAQGLNKDVLERDRELARAGVLAQELALAQALTDVNAGQQARHAPSLMEAQKATDQPTGRGHTASFLFLAPLLGLLWRDDRKYLRNLLLMLLLVGSLGTSIIGCAPMMQSAPASMEERTAESFVEETAEESYQVQDRADNRRADEPAKTPRLRQFFPETLFWLPELETDEQGQAQIEVPIADSITTWRVNVLASDAEGNLGSAQVGLPVFQEFFIEPDLPRFLTQYDELSVPISIFNYLDEAQEIQLSVEPASWFEFSQSAEVTIQIAANEVSVAYMPIRVTDFGQGDFKVTASSTHLSDAVLRRVDILPDGKSFSTVENGKLTETVSHVITLPEDMVPGTAQLTIKVFPGLVSQVIEGLEGLLRQPSGCFEQTSSTTYPNILVLDYLKTMGQLDPRIQLQAEQYINLGYQRLLTFEVPGYPGGFSLFGDPPPWPMLTAYGLMEFTDMSRVSYVDPNLLERTAYFLLSRQQGDGSWGPEGMTVESGWERLGNAQLPVTAYIVWALADAGYADLYEVQQAIGYIYQHVTPDIDPYALALVVNALVAVNPQDTLARSLLDSLLQQAKTGDGLVYWQSDLPTYMGGHGQVASIETSAMIAIALMRADYRLDIVQPTLDFLISQRDSFGAFQTTQSTILALKALLLAAQGGVETGEATVTITLDNGRKQTLSVNDENANVGQQIRFDDLGMGQHNLTLTVEGERTLHYQVITDYHLPWPNVIADSTPNSDLRVDVTYDRTELQVNDTVQVRAEVELLAPGQAGTILVDLGIPPGFSPITTDLDALIESGVADRFELTGRQILLYLTDVPSGQIFDIPYRLQARFPIKAQTGRSQAYDYYTPHRQDTQAPQRITVTLGTP